MAKKKSIKPALIDCHLLIDKAISIVPNDISRNEVEILIRKLHPKDPIETVLCAQVIALTLKGFSNMNKTFFNAESHGMMMLKLSHNAIDMLQRYRSRNRSIDAVID